MRRLLSFTLIGMIDRRLGPAAKRVAGSYAGDVGGPWVDMAGKDLGVTERDAGVEGRW